MLRTFEKPCNAFVFILLHNNRLIIMNTNEESIQHLMLSDVDFLLTEDPSTL